MKAVLNQVAAENLVIPTKDRLRHVSKLAITMKEPDVTPAVHMFDLGAAATPTPLEGQQYTSISKTTNDLRRYDFGHMYRGITNNYDSFVDFFEDNFDKDWLATEENYPSYQTMVEETFEQFTDGVAEG